MALPPWTIEILRRGLSDVARKASQPETIERIRTQAAEILQDLPQTAARSLDAVMRSAEAGKRSVQRWTRKHTTLAVPMLNATGVLLNDFGTGVPLADDIVQVGRELYSGDAIGGPAIQQRLSRLVHRLLPAGGDHSIAIAANFPAALAAFSLIAAERSLVVHRGHAVRLPDGVPLPRALANSLGDVHIEEVGSSNRIQLSDFDGLNHFCAVLADGGDRGVELFDFSGRDALQAVVLPVATMAASGDGRIPSAEAMLTAGADFVIMPGDGLCGGPPCGIVIGRKRELEQMVQSPAWRMLAASDAVQGMMAMTLQIADTSSEQQPVRVLLNTSEENLRGRAERLATRLSGSDQIASCQITADDARLTADGRWRLPSRQIRIRHRHRTADAWVSELLQDVPAVFATADGDDLRVDLRWIPAAGDAILAQTLAGSDTAEED